MIVLDTHALVWWAVGDRRLSARALRAIKAAARAGVAIVGSFIALVASTSKVWIIGSGGSRSPTPARSCRRSTWPPRTRSAPD